MHNTTIIVPQLASPPGTPRNHGMQAKVSLLLSHGTAADPKSLHNHVDRYPFQGSPPRRAAHPAFALDHLEQFIGRPLNVRGGSGFGGVHQ